MTDDQHIKCLKCGVELSRCSGYTCGCEYPVTISHAEMSDDERIIRKALQAGPTPGPWKSSGDVTGAAGPLFVATMAYEGDERRIVARIENRESARPLDNEDFANATMIAACSPDRIARLVARVERLEAALRQCHYALDRWLDCPEDAASYDNAMQRAILAEATARAALEGQE